MVRERLISANVLEIILFTTSHVHSLHTCYVLKQHGLGLRARNIRTYASGLRDLRLALLSLILR